MSAGTPRLSDLSALELAAEIAAGSVKSETAVQDYLERISTTDDTLGCFNTVFAERSLDLARRTDQAIAAGQPLPPLAGLPLAVKDNHCTLFGPTTCSSKILAGYHAPYQATVIDKLEQAGALIIGKTNMDEFAMGSSTENSCTAATRNPWNVEHVPGGSSGGSAAAVAARLCAGALGSDTGGSIRQPAAFCGVAGLKPTYGRVSRYGLVAYGSSLDQIGPLARDVSDCALILGTIAGHDPRDSTSIQQPVPDFLARIDEPVADLTVGLPVEFFSDALDGEIRTMLEGAVRLLRARGIGFKEVSLPHSRIDVDAGGTLSSYAIACYYIIAMAEASSNLSRYDGVHYGYRTREKTNDIVELYARSRSAGFGDEVKRRLMLGTYALSSGYYDAYYLKALKVRRLIKNDFDETFRQCDILLCPVTPTTAFKLGQNIDDPLTMYLQDIYTISLNLAGLPGLSLPCGVSRDGLPVGFQLVGPVLSEETLLRTGRLFETASGIRRLDPTEGRRHADAGGAAHSESPAGDEKHAL